LVMVTFFYVKNHKIGQNDIYDFLKIL